MRAIVLIASVTFGMSALAPASPTLAQAGTEATNLVVNGSLERGTAGQPFATLYKGSTAIEGWTVGRDDIDYITTYWPASAGKRSVDLSGSTGGSLVQELHGLVAGRRYRVTFDMAGNPDGGARVKTLLVVINRQSYKFRFDTTGSTRSNLRWQKQSFTFTYGGGASFLRFISLKASSYGPTLDNVRVVAAS